MTGRIHPHRIDELAPHLKRHTRKAGIYCAALAVAFGAFPYLVTTPSYQFADRAAEFATFKLVDGSTAWALWWAAATVAYAVGYLIRDRRALVAAVWLNAVGSMVFAVAIAERTLAGQASAIVGAVQWVWVAEHCYFILRTPFRLDPDQPWELGQDEYEQDDDGR